MKIAIIDYQLSNLFSVKHALDYLGIESEITSSNETISKSDAAIIPGVGAFGDAMNNLKKNNLIEVIKNHVKLKKPFMGVCLGMQLLFSESEEFGKHQGLGFFKGKVKKFEGNKKLIKVPQIGWNQILKPRKTKNLWYNSPIKNITPGEFMYFVHSYFVLPEDQNIILTETVYEDIKYCSAVIKDSIFATQFHPEKSGKEGIKIYKEWLNL